MCNEGDVRFTSGTSGTSYSYNTRTDVLSGNLEICVNGQYRYLCGQSNVTGFNASDIVAAACRQLGYVSKFVIVKIRTVQCRYTCTCLLDPVCCRLRKFTENFVLK